MYDTIIIVFCPISIRKELVEKKMCRSIQQLRQPEGLVSDELIQAAALQYVRKVSGFRKPSKRNQKIFDQAVAAVTVATREMLQGLESLQPLTTSGVRGKDDGW